MGKDISYKDGATELQGYMVHDPKVTTPQPGILIVHDWMGLTDRTKKKADQIAALGYTAFAVDLYGKGVRPKNPNEAAGEAGKYKNNRPLFRQRLLAALDWLKGQKFVDTQKLGAVGYCLGGTGVLELARAGAPLKGVVSFHGGLDSPQPADGKNIKGRVLALHGADDPFVKPEDLAAFENEMRTAKVDWQLYKFGNAVHSFTDMSAGTDNSKGAAYNEKADRRSWEDMRIFFKETL